MSTARQMTFKESMRTYGAAIAGPDRTGITPRPSTPQMKVIAWGAILVLYLIAWRDGTRVAVSMLLGWEPTPERFSSGTLDGLIQGLAEYIIVIAGALIGIRFFRRYAAATRPRPRVQTSIKAFFLAYAAVTIGFGVSSGIGLIIGRPVNTFEPSENSDPLLHTLKVIFDGMAGPAEELALLVFVVVALRATGHNWIIVTVAAIVVRVPFHLYYGWGAIGLAVWAALMVLLYRRTGAILAFVLEHASFNLLNHGGEIGIAIKAIIMIAGLLFAALTLIGTARRVDREHKQRANSALET